MMTTIEMKTNDTMQKTENTMDEASECVPARAFRSHVPRRMRTHDAKPVASEQSKNPCNAHRYAIPRADRLSASLPPAVGSR